MLAKRTKRIMYVLIAIITVLVVFPFIWMLVLSFKSNAEILSNPLALPHSLSWGNYVNALKTLDYPRLYANTFMVCLLALAIELVITFLSSFALARMVFDHPNLRRLVYGFLIAGLCVSPFILLFPVYKINIFFGLREQWALVFPYVASSISFNTLLFVGYLQALPPEIDEAAIIDGCSIWDLMIRIILPMTKPVIATVVIFNVLYMWNEYPFASVMLRRQADYTLAMGASFFKGTYTVDYGGIVASSVMIIIPELIFYGLFQKKIVGGMVAGAVKG
ncbi:carbohydrate ABC transporter permease [Bifidobacterium sp. B4107]|uniref:carbohydrate ABC transporter permease n=1 Tax=unclassified Bifidobacterium TaxID=2608897 RepID=UPI00226B7C82|nr:MULTISPECIES: carbohydrate ABC transporter permease [unclassified Bifidobacterium]MCX8648530.1 carbohydrate ABC transporter permease [Bifidobacterium sp. B4107]MCX8652727.1 carbohydrate ABC transporter permease [Bifidobacterium sp. B4111]MCX8659146.1 carbohydrate ABC transporter permease [Bifidobacterium sp. B4114]MCX8687937.1 carbohydrate ABC transporter permease [Bifidobacterium sp. B4142]